VALPASEPTVDPAAVITAQLAQPIAAASESNAPQPSQIPGELNWDGVQRTAKVPILMYHYVSTPPANADIYRKDLSVTPELFNAQLDRIQAEGYTTISLYDLINHLTTGAALPAKPVILTFDDGYRDNYENAFPALKAHGMRATIFVVVDFINAQRPEYMTWDMLREMHNAGLSIESHGIDHSSLKNRDRDSLVFQALRTYETLQNELGQRARFISYPAGQYDQNTIDAFKGAGYWAGITTLPGATHSTDHLFELHRVRVRGTTSADDLAKLLATDW
ncbi:MAG: polysaccharide deacetylase family protein, partial [Verrucomicrobia subdivision 3 bacterium]|nr:polysaccharide deacetylase family protein [Limisphaerales bacterium]